VTSLAVSAQYARVAARSLREARTLDTGEELACKVTVLRSLSPWSGGVNLENSIEKAYKDLIANARHYIRIENQFFVSGTAGKRVQNGIAEALVERISRAIRNRENFRVVVILPLLPSFPGSPLENAAMRLILHWQYATICRGSDSIYARIKPLTDHPEKYISFYGLRTWGQLPEGLCTEQVYVHGKLMIVDDRSFICGSANINDRSMLGSNDSEVAVLVEDCEETVNSLMFGRKWRAGKIAHAMRVRLDMTHLGLETSEIDEVLDPCSEAMLERMEETAQNNTLLYRDMFRCIPDDNVRDWNDLRSWSTVQPPSPLVP